jgi:predicted nucleic acid-binding protein
LACSNWSGDARQDFEHHSATAPAAIALPVEILGELFNVLVRKAKRRPAGARAVVLSCRDAYPTIETSAAVMIHAMDLAADHGLTIWDAVVVAASAKAECRLLLSEGLQVGFTWGGVTGTNPFAPTLHPLLAAAIAE